MDAIIIGGEGGVLFERTFQAAVGPLPTATLLRAAQDHHVGKPVASIADLTMTTAPSGMAAARAPVAVLRHDSSECLVVHCRVHGMTWCVVRATRPGVTVSDVFDHHADMFVVTATQFLADFIDVLSLYWDSLTPIVVSSQAVLIGQILDEMVCNGIPTHIQRNQLTAILPVPDLLSRVATTVMGQVITPMNGPTTAKASALAPWRRVHVKYTVNEVYLDVEEYVSGVLMDPPTAFHPGAPSSPPPPLHHLQVRGYLHCNSKLSGTPELHLLLSGVLPGTQVVARHECLTATSAMTKASGSRYSPRPKSTKTADTAFPTDMLVIPPDSKSTLLQYAWTPPLASIMTGSGPGPHHDKWLTAQASRNASTGRVTLQVTLPTSAPVDWTAADRLRLAVPIPPRYTVATHKASVGVTNVASNGVLEWLPTVAVTTGSSTSGPGSTPATAAAGAAGAASAALSKLAVSAASTAAPTIARGLSAAASGLAQASTSASRTASGSRGRTGPAPSLTLFFAPNETDSTAAVGYVPFHTTLSVSGVFIGSTVTGVRVNKVMLQNEDYKFYQGVRCSAILESLDVRVSCP
ncbi:hypothetical protein AMAG_12235 [Allomyces macrogynus ATCC 38327]|uniref:MHD domain-containing protein n=1 Tax=Allomyces macrogynus (strain ATCC 38327) TaxID=578462 RepID=A0A0L0SXN9_ALLM3|nr:hypothetical protein AMAG_12235 [Allomyces macrogynus ATCC 38327]|eukprot:KNE67165.1 hypothetical protein AMAG_12235 [Allomyces macrogynus ATCC 38327]